MSGWRRWGNALSCAGAIVVRPSLWRAALRLVPPHWWRRWPPLPFPTRDYLAFRLETMYGTDGALNPRDVVAYLEWCRRIPPPAR